ncbi:MAG: hypothetical protein GJ677_05430 [Rhodobacteraceae bacterium]|nr:hypothetical protein [Paracoccaceae bacterium]
MGFEVAAGMAGGFEGWRLALAAVAGGEAAGASASTDFTVGAVAFAAALTGVSVFTTDLWVVVVLGAMSALAFAVVFLGAFVLAFFADFGAAGAFAFGVADLNSGSEGAGLVAVFEAGAAALVLVVAIDLARGLRFGAACLAGALVTAGFGALLPNGASMVPTSARFMAWVMRIWRSTMRDIKK